MFEAKVAEKVFRDMLAGVPYRVGRESRETFGEGHARCSAQTSRSAWGKVHELTQLRDSAGAHLVEHGAVVFAIEGGGLLDGNGIR
jgi:hypothetical protein